MPKTFVEERAISPVDRDECWVVVCADDYELHVEASAYLASLRAAGRSPNTIRVYAGRIAKYLSYCSAHEVRWNEPRFEFLAEFLRHLSTEPLQRRGSKVSAPVRRSNNTANSILVSVCEFLRFSCTHRWTPTGLVDRLSKPKFLHHVPSGFNPGARGDFRHVNARTLKLPETSDGIHWLTPAQIGAITATVTRPRDRFLITLMGKRGSASGKPWDCVARISI